MGKGIEQFANEIMVTLYLSLLATKTKNVKNLSVLITLVILISLRAFNFLPKYFIENFQNDHRLNTYLPVLILIILSELILSNSKILMLVDRRVFLTIFRIKHIITIIMVPRLWIGDQSLVLKSHLFQTYQVLFWGSTFLIAFWIVYNGILILIIKSKKYGSILQQFEIVHSKSDPQTYFYYLKQSKFEMILLFSLNLLPAYLFLSTQQQLPDITSLICI
jgi:hypothetical protein